MITSPHNPRIKLLRALAGRSKERRAAGAFLAEGVRLVEDALSAHFPFQFALYRPDLSKRGLKLISDLREAGVDVEEVDPLVFRSASETETSQGVAAVLKLPEPGWEVQETPGFILIPDQIRDPGNLGSLIRSAAAAGVKAVIIPPGTTDPFAPKVIRAGMGAHFRMKIHSMTWQEIASSITGIQVFLAAADGQTSCWQSDFRQPLALIVGGEAAGASPAARNLANHVINIPMPGKIESLNAGVAGAVLMFEVVRQRSEEQ